MSDEDRLDDLVAALAAARPVLDDVTRARVGAALAARGRRVARQDTRPPLLVLAGPAPVAPPRPPISMTTASAVPVSDLSDGPDAPATAPPEPRTIAPSAVLASRPREPRVRRVRAVVAMVAAIAVAAIAVVWISQQPRPEVDQRFEHPAPAAAMLPPSSEQATAKLRARALATLRASLRSVEPRVRTQGADAVADCLDDVAIERLTELTERDPDLEVRGHAAEALGRLGASSAAPLLARLEATAPPPLNVFYASALARLGDPRAATRLLGYAHGPDMTVAVRAALALTEVGQLGNDDVRGALRAIAARESELDQVHPYAGVMILTRFAALGDAKARKMLHALLSHADESMRLAGAEALAKLGDDAGEAVLAAIAAQPTSPNQLVAATVQAALGDDRSLEVLTRHLTDRDPDSRRLTIHALGMIGNPRSLPVLAALETDRDPTVNVAAAAAIMAILRIDPQALAQAATGWAQRALASRDPAVRGAAAGVLADLPTRDALALLATALGDPDPDVRRAAATSAARLAGSEVAVQLVRALSVEVDLRVKEPQVQALAALGPAAAAAHDILARIADQPGRLGVIAAGALIATGDPSGHRTLDAAIAAPEAELRLAAVQAAASANDPIVTPTLLIGISDHVFHVRFAAAEALASYAQRDAATPVLAAAVASRTPDIAGRAIAALLRLGQTLGPEDAATQAMQAMIDAPDPGRRLAAIPILRALPVSSGARCLRRLLVDLDRDVRRAAVDALADIARQDRARAIALYKPLVADADPVIRAKASGQLSRLLAPP